MEMVAAMADDAAYIPGAGYDGPDKVSIERAGEIFGVSPETVRGWYKRGRIPKYPRPLDRRIMVSVADIRAAMTPGGPVWTETNDNPSAE